MMKQLRRCGAFAATVMALAAAPPARAVPKPGQAAPTFTARSPKGQTVRLQDLRGKVVLLDFWMPECPPCVLAMPALQRLQNRYGTRGLRVVGVAENSPNLSAAERFRKRLGVKYPYFLDNSGAIFRKYGLNTHPTTVLIDAKGAVRQVGEGYVKGDEKEIEAALKPLLRGVKPGPKVSARGRR